MSSIPEAFQLDGQVALVTGASFGLGYGMAAGLAEAGSDIIAVSRSIENLANIEQTVRQMGRLLHTLDTANTYPSGLRRLVQALVYLQTPPSSGQCDPWGTPFPVRSQRT